MAPASTRARRLVAAAAVVCGLIVARPAGLRSQDSTVPLAWTFSVMGAVEPGCRPRVTTAGLAYDAQGNGAAAWSQEICGPAIDPLFPELPNTPVRVARYLNGEWTGGAKLPDPACTLQGCPGLRGEPPGLGLDLDGHPILFYEAISDASGTYSARRTKMVPGMAPVSVTLGRIGHYQSCYTTWPAFSVLAGPGGNMVSVLGTSCQGTGWLSIGGVTIQGQGPDDAAAVGQGGAFTSVASAYGGGDFPRHLAYFVERGLSRGVYYAPNAGSVERLVATPHMNRGAEVSIAADANNTIHLVAGGIPVGANPLEGGLLYATSTTGGETWTKVFLDEVSGRHPSIALDPAGRPAVAYWRGSELRFASFASGEWTNQLVTMTGTDQFANRPRLAFDPQGRPHILFLDPGSGNLQVANGAEGSHAPGMVKVNRAGSGHVRSLSPGIDCGTDCAESYPAGMFVTLVATGTPQVTRFAGWLGACTGTGPCTVRAAAAQTSVTAMFARVYGGHEITVTSMAGGTGSVGDCTLGEAIQAANTDAAVDACPAGREADVILVPPGAITIAGPYSDPSYGLPPVYTAITIRGSGQDRTFIQRRPFGADGRPIGGADPLGLFFVRPTGLPWPYTGQLHLERLTIRGGVAAGAGAAVYVQNAVALLSDVTLSHNTTAGVGGAVSLNGGTLTIERARFLDNASTSDGGALSATGILSVSDSDFARNTAVGNGGAVSVGGAGTVAAIAHSTFTANSAEWEGGAIHNTAVLTLSASIVNGNSLRSGFTGAGVSAGTLTLIDSVIDGNTHGSGLAVNGKSFVTGTLISSNNSGWSGGGVNARGNLTMVNSTISGNQASAHGGGIYFDHGQSVTLNNVTIANNRAVTGEGGGFYRAFSGQDFRLSNSIVAGNSGNGGVPDCVGELGPVSATSLGHNVIGVNTCLTPAAGDLVGTRTEPLDPKLGPLQDNGGPTWTHALGAGSVALEAGSAALPGDLGACERVDQRAMKRPGRQACDIGAFERQNNLPTVAAFAATTAEDTAVASPVTGQDEDGDPFTFVVTRLPLHGVVTGTSPNFTYTPDANYFGTDSFGVSAADIFQVGPETSVSVVVTPVNDPPTARDDAPSVAGNEIHDLHVLANDSVFPDADETLTITTVTPPQHGQATIVEAGTRIRYTPDRNYSGPDSLTYTISDGHGASAIAAVSIMVTPAAVITIDIEERIAVTDTPGVVPAVQIAVTETIAVTDTPAVTPAVQIAVTETIAVSDAPDVNPQNTPPGTDVVVTPVDMTTGTKPVSVKYGSVAASGATTVVSSGSGPATPSGYSLGSPATFFEISTTATYSGSISVCINYSGVTFPSGTEPRLMHYEGGAWVDRTTSVDAANTTVCGTVSSLSPFAVFGRVTFKLRALYDEAAPNKAGSTVPIKVQVLDASGRNVSSATMTVTAISLREIATGRVITPEAAGNANPAGAFRYDDSLQGYIYNLKTTGLTPGTSALSITINSTPALYEARVQIR